MSPAINKGKSTSPSRRRRLLIVALIIGILSLLIAAGGTAWLLSTGARTTGQTSSLSTANNGDPVSEQHRVETEVIAQQYMTALLKQQYHAMWTLLHPQVQALWPGEAAFAKFWQVRFQDYTFQGFMLGQVHGLRQWTNPETMVVYTQVILLPISLQLQPRSAVQQQADAPPRRPAS